MIFPAFGARPSGQRAKDIKQSPNYRDGQFQNPEPTEMLIPSASTARITLKFFNKPANTRPPVPLPSVLTGLENVEDETAPVILWFGHSSYCILYQGKTILVDPVFGGYASPVSFFGKEFAGTNTYGADDFKKVDLLVITHDHYDHLDYPTIKKLNTRVTKIVTSLGVGAHLASWGIPSEKITELDWWESVSPAAQVKLTAAPARHFSGRLFTRNQTLWSSFILELDGYKLFIGGDSGYGRHFKEIGEKAGPFDLAILEAGQYNTDWPFIHMLPEDALPACRDLGAKAILPVHWGKFALALHPWNEPVKRIINAFAGSGIRVAAPMIGEPVVVGGNYPIDPWWEL